MQHGEAERLSFTPVLCCDAPQHGAAECWGIDCRGCGSALDERLMLVVASALLA